MKLFINLICVSLLFVAQAASAEQAFPLGFGEQPLKTKVSKGVGKDSAVPLMNAELELYPLRIKISNDGTGIIKNIKCAGCDYSIGKITKNTRVYVNNVNVDLFRAREREGTLVLVEFVRSTGEIMSIRWSEKKSK